MNHSSRHYKIYEKTVRDEIAFIKRDLTFPDISFTIFFCQNKVKKIHKFVVRVSFKNTDMRCRKNHGKYVSFLLWGFLECCNVILLLCEQLLLFITPLSGIFLFSWCFMNKTNPAEFLLIHYLFCGNFINWFRTTWTIIKKPGR